MVIGAFNQSAETLSKMGLYNVVRDSIWCDYDGVIMEAGTPAATSGGQ